MHLDALPKDKASLPSRILAALDAATETIRDLGPDLSDRDQIELCQAMRTYFEVRLRSIERAARDRKESDDPFGLRKPKGPVLVPMPGSDVDGGAA